MDIAVIKSWNEVLRITDPVIWNLAMDMDMDMDMNMDMNTENNGRSQTSSTCTSSSKTNMSNGNAHIVTHAQLKHSTPSLSPVIDKDTATLSTSPLPSSSSSSSSTSSSSPVTSSSSSSSSDLTSLSSTSSSSSHKTPNFCRSLLEPHSQNTLDWLRCLIIQTTMDESKDGDQNGQRRNRELRRFFSRTMTDHGPAGE
ncbi:hypothetical protein BGZ94_002272, partial [Podila epigama]